MSQTSQDEEKRSTPEPSTIAPTSKAGLYAAQGHEAEGFDLAPIDAKAERRLVWKLGAAVNSIRADLADFTVLPALMAIYLLNFIDRSNIGNARAAGLGPDFGISNNEYYSSLTLYYAVYGAANIPANYVLKYLANRSGGSHWWLAFMTLAFGAITFSHAYIQSYGQLMAVRALLGILEGFTLPGVTYILSRYYTRRELIFRISVRGRLALH